MSEQKFNPATPNFRTEAATKIAQLFPEVVADGQIDFDALQEALSPDLELTGGEEKYEFTWRGKRDAKRIADVPARDTTLVANKDKSKNWDSTQNVYIEGDNLEVLKLLQKAYAGKIDMIYIDPPYNTGHDFVYHDDFHDSYENYLKQTGQVDSEGNATTTNKETNGRFHTDWLNMMYPRLKLARNLLSDSGVIFISIDDNEQVNLKLLMDEVFGQNNFVSTLTIENNPKGRKNSDFISVSSEFAVAYAKQKSDAHFTENVPKKSTEMKQDENGNFVHGSGKRILVGENKFNQKITNYSSNKHYSVYHNSKLQKMVLRKENNVSDFDDDLVQAGYVRYISLDNGMFVENTYSDKKFKNLFDNNALQFTDEKIFEKNFSSKMRLKSVVTNLKYEAIINNEKVPFKLDLKTTSAGQYLKGLFNNREVFQAPKSKDLIKLFMTLFLKKNLTVLDFFAGSGTTADAVMQLNAEDGGYRKVISVQLPEITDHDSEAFRAGYKTIPELSEERIRRAGDKIVSEHPELKDKLDVGFKVYELQPSTIKQWQEVPDQFEEQLALFEQNPFTESSDNQQRAQEIALKSGMGLNVNPTITDDIYHFVFDMKEVFVVLGDYDDKLLKRLEAQRELPIATVVLRELADGSEIKFNLLEMLKQDSEMNNHFNLEWL